MSAGLNWDDLRFFLAVAEAGSLSAASSVLKVNTTTVLRRVASLEDSLGARLFDRSRSGYRLTPRGERLQRARHLLVSRRRQRCSPGHRCRITATVSGRGSSDRLRCMSE